MPRNKMGYAWAAGNAALGPPGDYRLCTRKYKSVVGDVFRSTAVRPADFDAKVVQLLDWLFETGRLQEVVVHLKHNLLGIAREKVRDWTVFVFTLLRSFDRAAYNAMRERRGSRPDRRRHGTRANTWRPVAPIAAELSPAVYCPWLWHPSWTPSEWPWNESELNAKEEKEDEDIECGSREAKAVEEEPKEDKDESEKAGDDKALNEDIDEHSGIFIVQAEVLPLGGAEELVAASSPAKEEALFVTLPDPCTEPGTSLNSTDDEDEWVVLGESTLDLELM